MIVFYSCYSYFAQVPATVVEVGFTLSILIMGTLFYQSAIVSLTVIAETINASAAEFEKKLVFVRQVRGGDWRILNSYFSKSNYL